MSVRALTVIWRTWLLVLLAAAIFNFAATFSHARPARPDGSSYMLGAGSPGWVSCTQANCASSATTFFTTSVTTLYRISASVTCTSAVAAGTAIMVIKYTDPSNTVQTVTLATATCTTLGSASISSLSQAMNILTGTNIQYNITAANAPSYQARIAVYQEGVN
jgi:hypothetical protein